MALRHRRLMDADEGRHADQQADDHDRQRGPAPLDAGCDRFADAVIRLRRHAHTLRGRNTEQIKRKPQRDHDGGRDAGDRDGTAWARTDDGVDAFVLGA